MKEKKELSQGDFYRWFKKQYPEIVEKLGSKWNIERWNPRYDYFSVREDHGFRLFVNTLPEPFKSNINNIVFEFLSEPLDTNDLMKEIQTIVNNYWNKITICKTLDTDEERKFRDIMKGLKSLSILHTLGTLRTLPKNYQYCSIRLEDIEAKDFTYSELPPDLPDAKLITTRVFPTSDGFWWELQNTGIEGNGVGKICFKANEIKKVPEMKCTIQDGVFMAIPSDLMDKKLTQRFQKLLSDNSNDKPQGKVSKKKRKKPTENEIYEMDVNQLVKVIEDFDLNIDIDDYDEDDEIALQDRVVELL